MDPGDPFARVSYQGAREAYQVQEVFACAPSIQEVSFWQELPGEGVAFHHEAFHQEVFHRKAFDREAFHQEAFHQEVFHQEAFHQEEFLQEAT